MIGSSHKLSLPTKQGRELSSWGWYDRATDYNGASARF